MSNVTFYGWRNKFRDLLHEGDPDLEQQRLEEMLAETANVSGDLWVDDGFVPVELLEPQQSPDGIMQYGGSTDNTGSWPLWANEDLYDSISPGANQARFCFNWVAKYTDSGFGEAYLAPPTAQGWTVEPGRFVRAMVLEGPSPHPLFKGWLDESGCTPLLQLAGTGIYHFVVSTRLKKDDVIIRIGATTPNLDYVDEGHTTHSFSKTASNLNPVTFTPRRIAGAPMYDQIGAVVSRALITPENGFSQGNVWLHVKSESDCQPTSGASAAGDPQSKKGWGQFCPKSTSYKYVIAHELGHIVQGLDAGLPLLIHKQWETDGAPSACGCAHVTSSNQFHCLQSRENTGVAHVEGFAHLYAAKVMNDLSPTSCTFVYYKEFWDNGTILLPPIPKDCTEKVTWMETQCLQAARGVEWDWNNFLWAIHTAPQSDRSSLSDLFGIYKEACAPAGKPYCTSFTDMLWPAFRDAAENYYGGLTDARYVHLQTQADDFGVDY
jgi:hypothetical protein